LARAIEVFFELVFAVTMSVGLAGTEDALRSSRIALSEV
jgi:hypothetical protein